MDKIQFYKTDRVRVCKLCGETIDKEEEGIVMKNIKVSPKVVDLHFHKNCFVNSVKNVMGE